MITITRVKATRLMSILFSVLTVGFIILMAVNQEFFNWAFSRHQNLISWYIRPLIILPLCFFSYRRSTLGLSVTAFLGLTSMFWFPQPEVVDEHVVNFLEMEKVYLTSHWTLRKVLVSSLVPITLYFLCLSFWKRSLKAGIMMVVLIAFGKVGWSFYEGGETGVSAVAPAMTGLVFCMGVIYFTIRRKRYAQKEEKDER